mgnify:CR=1 FL=1
METNTSFKDEDLEPILTKECFLPPSFIEYDNHNKLLIIKNSLGTIKAISMENYKELYDITDRNCVEVRKSQEGIALIKQTDFEEKFEIDIYNIKNGKKIINIKVY